MSTEDAPAPVAVAPATSYGVAERLGWGTLGVAAGVATVLLGAPWLLLAWLAPDLGVLAGGVRIVDEQGRLRRRAAIGYNTTHSLLGPLVLAAIALVATAPGVGALVALWVCHIGVDRALGYTLKPVPARA